MKKIVFLGSKEIGAFGLEYLVSNEKSLNAKVISVFTNPMISMNSPGNLAQFAQSKNIPVLDNLENLLNLPEVDYIISVQYHEILHQNTFPKRANWLLICIWLPYRNTADAINFRSLFWMKPPLSEPHYM